MDPVLIAASVLLPLLFLLFVGVPIGVGFSLVGFGAVAYWINFDVAMRVAQLSFKSATQSFYLVAIPMFILAGEVILVSGLGMRLVKCSAVMMAGLPGGLLLASRFATTIFSAVTGSSVASSATVGKALMKDMIDQKYDRALTAGSMAAGGGLAVIMPPSILLVIYGFMAEVSIAKLFLAGVFPALVMAVLYAAWNVIVAIRRPDLAPRTDTATWGARLRAARDSWPMLALIAVVLGGIYTGFATVTEASVLSVLGATLLSRLSGTLPLATFRKALLETVNITGMIFLILIGTVMLRYFMTYFKVAEALTGIVLHWEVQRYVLLVAVIALLVALGTFMETLSLVLVAVIVLVQPMMALGFDPIWLGILFSIAIEMGLTTPPFGLNLFVVQGVGKATGTNITYAEVVRGSFPYLVLDCFALALVIIFPAIALWLPGQ